MQPLQLNVVCSAADLRGAANSGVKQLRSPSDIQTCAKLDPVPTVKPPPHHIICTLFLKHNIDCVICIM